ncbi:hypothetical protein GcC1_111014 [Golovinomyces cichoracearum]|uniref:Uncharacterized protein n=1 Tax=Golovinomyces cichoracearum TaxID=62708 RepID=A0A420I8T3_9PEZI|nr:hypothetical protein GcC1_111014 [Golovinomyces cichoracearum]
MWAAAIGGGIYERAIVYNFDDHKNQMQIIGQSTHHTNYDTPMYVSVIQELQTNFKETKDNYFRNIKWGEAKYLRLNNHASFCNKEERAVNRLWYLGYGRLPLWKPEWSDNEYVTMQDMKSLPGKIQTVSDEKTLRTLLSSAGIGAYQITGNNCFFPLPQLPLNAPSIFIENGVSLWLVALIKYVETLCLEDYTYAFIVDKVHGFKIASVKGIRLHYSPLKDNYFLRASYKLHTASGENPLIYSAKYSLAHFVIGNNAGSVSSAHDVRVGNSESALVS